MVLVGLVPQPQLLSLNEHPAHEINLNARSCKHLMRLHNKEQ